MAKNKKGKVFYEITREKPVGKSQVLLMGSSFGAAVSFFIVSVLGSLYGVEMDNLIFFFILSSIVGFFVGGLLTRFFVLNFSKVVDASSVLSAEKATEEASVQSVTEINPESMTLAEEGKGQSVDFVFPELSPDK